jgi:predicted SprT family Zn-dependent metalloprotease
MLTDNDKLRARFRENDLVMTGKRKPISGPIIRMNRTTATIQCDSSGDEYLVPFELLNHQNPAQSRDAAQKIEAVDVLAAGLLDKFELNGWIFRLDHSTRRAGCCNYRDRKISIAFGLACNATDEDIRDTLLHEIAHALVGKKHNHDAVWQAKANEIGCSAERTHRLVFSPPRYHVTCTSGCWKQTAERRNRRLVCRKCGGKLIYSPYNAQTV